PEKTIPDDSPSKSPSVAQGPQCYWSNMHPYVSFSYTDGTPCPATTAATSHCTTYNLTVRSTTVFAYFPQLGPKRRVTVRKWKNSQFIDIREYYVDKSGSEAPGKKGISLSMAQWKALKECIYDVDQLLESD
ncbi:hypothetical protein IWQ62_004893, partial [Dispira parvispora]